MQSKPANCYITGLTTQEVTPVNNDSICYSVLFKHLNLKFVFSAKVSDWTERGEIVNDNITVSDLIGRYLDKYKKLLLKGLILNQKWFPNESEIITKKQLERIIESNMIPRNPLEKKDFLLVTLYHLQKNDGYLFEFRTLRNTDELARFYMESSTELNMYLHELESDGYVKVKYNSSNNPEYFNITFKGILRVREITEEGINSKTCFIAMSFDKSDNYIYVKGIKPACLETGFVPVIVNDIKKVKIRSDQTINDAIIASIKSCKFLIADFTKQKHGVYFEAGYALGRGKKVIYLCNKKDFRKCHFDTNHFPHIVYNSVSELRSMLIDRINAWVKD